MGVLVSVIVFIFSLPFVISIAAYLSARKGKQKGLEEKPRREEQHVSSSSDVNSRESPDGAVDPGEVVEEASITYVSSTHSYSSNPSDSSMGDSRPFEFVNGLLPGSRICLQQRMCL